VDEGAVKVDSDEARLECFVHACVVPPPPPSKLRKV
jgi:hypothetical protein